MLQWNSPFYRDLRHGNGVPIGVEMATALGRTILAATAVAEFAWSLLFYLRPEAALAVLGRGVVDPVICRQYPLYLASAALAYALIATNPVRYAGMMWIGLIQRAVELAVAFIDWRAHAISTAAFFTLGGLEVAVAAALIAAMRSSSRVHANVTRPDPRDRGLVRLLRGFGALEVFWFLASTIFVQLGSRLLNWKLQDPYTTQQQGIALLIIGLTSLWAASDIARYRIFVWVPVASQLIGIVNSFNEIRLGSIGWNVAATQWAIELTMAGAFMYYSRHALRASARRRAFAE
jgi:hypothetical protein